ncbi:MAG: hypothetical protein LBS50_11685, partial [Prevotellaceae bacterium]|jgi:hypothetical protein|nr:hypothetical protein [Prevotellaceae bacterium]
VGHYYPQVSYGKEYNPDSGIGLFRLCEDFGNFATKFPDFTPDLSGFKLVRGAKLTDFLSGGQISNSLTISPKVKFVFEQFNLCPHRFYNMTILYKKEPQNYFMFHYLSNFSDFVDYKKSTFVEDFLLNGTGENVEVNSKEELFIRKEEVKQKYGKIIYSVTGKSIVMNKEFSNMQLDFFEILIADNNGAYVSERLKNAIEGNGLTGVEFTPATHLVVES